MEWIYSHLRKLPEHIQMLLRILVLFAAVHFYFSIIFHDINFELDAFQTALVGALFIAFLASPVIYRWAIHPYELFTACKYNKTISDLRNIQKQLEKANEELRDQANTDPLTGLSNRRSYEQRLLLEYMAATRHELPLTILMMDIDNFKLFNDKYGHLAGDNALTQVAGSLKTTFGRAIDFIGRFGGEEFVAILPNTDEEGAKIFAERIRKNIERLQIPHKDSTCSDHVTLSIGAATMSKPLSISKDQLVKVADDCLYKAKEQGRNRVVSKVIKKEKVSEVIQFGRPH